MTRIPSRFPHLISCAYASRERLPCSFTKSYPAARSAATALSTSSGVVTNGSLTYGPNPTGARQAPGRDSGPEGRARHADCPYVNEPFSNTRTR